MSIANDATRFLQADPKELPEPRRQIEGGDIAGHVEQFQAKKLHDVADDDQARLGDAAGADLDARSRSRLHSPPPATQK